MATSTPSKRNAAIFADTITTTGNVVIGGDLTVSGTTTTINTETINLADNIIVLNSNASGAATENAGIEIERGTDTNVSLIWDENNNRWTVGSSNFVAGTFIGALSGNASTASSAAKWTTARTLSLTGAVTGSVSIDGSGNVSLATTATSDPTLTLTGDVTGSATFTNLGNATLTATVANDSHSHSFGGLTGKTSGTGDYSTNGDLVAGRGSGSIALTINDGKGNSNVTFNHQNGVPDQNGNAARIEVNTDSTSGASMNFELKSNVTGGTSVDLTSILNLSESQVTSYKTLYENSNRVFTDAYHPNADKWTTARTNTVTLTGAVTGSGSASVDGSGNWTVTVPTTTNHTHNYDNYVSWTAKDHDGTTYTVTSGDTLWFKEGGAIDVNFTADDELTISHADTSSQGSVNNSNGTVIQDVTLDGYGHVTGLASVDLDTRYVNVTGDTMTGALTISSTVQNLLNIYNNTNAGGATINFSDNGGQGQTGQITFYHSDAESPGSAYGASFKFNTDQPNLAVILDETGDYFVGTNKVFHDGYHPNADKWTTPRTNTVSLTGDVTGTGSASVDGTGNWTVSVPAVVVNDSHSHSNYVLKTGDTMTGPLTISNTNDVQLYLNGNGSTWAGIRWTDSGGYADMWCYGATGTFALGGGGSTGVSGKRLHVDGATSIGSGFDTAGIPTDGLRVQGEIWDNNANIFSAYRHSGSDFADGTLVQTDIPATAASGASFVIEVTGKSYSSEGTFDFSAQGYLYNSTIINYSGYNNGDARLTYIKAMEYNGYLCFWWPRISYWNSFEVRVRDAGGNPRNRVTTIGNATDPSTATKKVQINLRIGAYYGRNQSTGNLYATRYYDSNDTGYYSDPASTSNYNTLNVGTINRDPTVTLSGDVTGSATMTNLGSINITTTVANNSHTHDTIDVQDVRNTTPLPSGLASKQVQSFFNNQTIPNGLSGWYSTLTVKGWDGTYAAWELAGNAASSAQDGLFFRYGSTSWNAWQRVFTDNYHPNADKWTTARTNTVSLTGDVTGTGSASVDGTGNWTVSIPTAVANDSHSHSNYVLKTGDTMTGRLVLPDSGYSIGDEYHKWKSSYVVNSSSPKELLYHDGNSLPAGGAYRFHAHIAGTGTDQSATAVYWNQNGVWKVNVTYQSGTSSNNPEFIIAGSPERPTIHIDHPSNYTVMVLGERLELSEGTGTDNLAGFGTDAFLGSVGGTLRYNNAGSGNDYAQGNIVFHDGYHPNADKWTTARTNTVSLTGDVTGTGSASVDGTGNWTVSISTAVGNNSHGHNWVTTQALSSADDLDNITSNGSYRWTSSAPANSPSGNYHNMFVQSDGGQPTQLVWGGSGASSQDIHIRRRDSGTWRAWTTFWNNGNDGSGSGLDADLLDGQHGSYYYSSANIPPKIKAGGDGPNAENLNTVADSVSVGQLEYRGFNSSSSNAPPVSDNANGVITVGQHNGNYNAQLAFSSNGNMYWRDNPSTSFGSWRTVWDSGNDGSGSGLDADLLDGQHGSYYAPASSLSGYVSKTGDTMTGTLNANASQGITLGTASSRSKLSVYSGGPYQIGMQSGVTYGGLNDWAMTFQFNNETDRGFWWGHDGHTTAQGAMSLTTAGHLFVGSRVDAPIFYDSNNTSYYGNFASTSRMNAVYANQVYLAANASYRFRFWNGSNDYAIGMSDSGNATYGGRAPGETTSDYNMYFTMGGGTNRGFVFRNSNAATGAVAGIDSTGTGYFPQLRFGGLNPTVEYDFDGTGATTAADALAYLKFGSGIATGTNLAAVECISPNWSAISGVTYADNKFRIMSARGSGEDALKAAVNLSTVNGEGDTTIIGNVNIDGTNTRLVSGIGISGLDVYVVGDLIGSGDITAYSDERLKENIETLDGSKVYEMRGVSFTKDGKAGSGVVAQELEKVAPELVHDSGDYKAVAYGNLVGYLIEAVKELKAEVDDLKAQLAQEK